MPPPPAQRCCDNLSAGTGASNAGARAREPVVRPACDLLRRLLDVVLGPPPQDRLASGAGLVEPAARRHVGCAVEPIGGAAGLGPPRQRLQDGNEAVELVLGLGLGR